MFFINKVEVLEESLKAQSEKPGILSRVKTESQKIYRSLKKKQTPDDISHGKFYFS